MELVNEIALASLVRRADELDTLAGRLGAVGVAEVLGRAGDDTWLGPTADAFVAVVVAGARGLAEAAADLRRQAVVLRNEAARLRAELVRVETTR